jgi:hypothetical protein
VDEVATWFIFDHAKNAEEDKNLIKLLQVMVYGCMGTELQGSSNLSHS